MRADSFLGQQTWIEYQNDSGEEIPAHGVIRINGFTDPYIVGLKPDAFGLTFPNAVNGPVAVADGARGMCTLDPLVWVDYDTGDTPAIGEHWGPINADWEIAQHSVGFVVIGGATDGRVLCQRTYQLHGQGQADGAISQDSSGTVSVYRFNGGTWTDVTAHDITCRALVAIGSGDRVAWQWDWASDQFIAAGCG